MRILLSRSPRRRIPSEHSAHDGLRGNPDMKCTIRTGLIACALVSLAAAYSLRSPEAKAQRARTEALWEYKVGVVSYNPGERLNDEQRSRSFERTINEQAREGWELVGSVLNRNTIQTVGGAVTTRDSTSFLAYRRPRK